MTSMIRFGVAAALGLVSAQAFAAGVATTDNTLLIGGATATDRTLLESFIDLTDGICENNAPDADADDTNDNTTNVYFAGAASTTGPANFTVRCRVRAGVTNLAGVTIQIGKFSGGSETGIVNVAAKSPTAIAGNPVTFADPTSPTCVAGTATGSGTSFVQYKVYQNCGSVVPGATATFDASNPRFGISDVEPKLFGLSTAGLQSVESAVDVTFAPVLSSNFYAALQTAQGLAGARTVYRSVGADGVAGTADDVTSAINCNDSSSTDEACLPSLTTAQVRGVLSQKVPNVTDFRVNGVALPAPTGGAQIRICRRGDTSGTQKSFENFFFGQGCQKNPQTVFARDTTVQDATVTPVRQCSDIGCAFKASNIGPTGIFQGTGSGDVEACLNDAVTAGVYAIGILSTDRVPNNDTKRFRYFKLDGVSPLLQNVVDGRYSFFSENTVITATGLTTGQSNIATALKGRFRTPTLLDSTLVSLGISTNGVLKPAGGLLVRPTTLQQPGTPPVDYVVRPVNTQIKGVALGGVNPTVDNCIPAAFVQGTDSSVGPLAITSP